MGLQIRRASSTKQKLLLTTFAVFALIVQPFYGLVASYVTGVETASAASIYASAADSSVTVPLSDVTSITGSWAEVPGADGYVATVRQGGVQIHQGALPNSFFTISGGIVTASAAAIQSAYPTEFAALAQPGVYTWNVIAYEGSVTNTLGSATEWATVTITPDKTANLQISKNGTTVPDNSYVDAGFVSGNVVLNFDAVASADQYITEVTYPGGSRNFWNSYNNTWIVSGGTVTGNVFGQYGDGAYVYKVKARNTITQQWSDWSESVTLHYDSSRPTVELVSPTTTVINAATPLQINATDNLALNRVVANVRNASDTLVLSTQSGAAGAANYSHSVNVSSLSEGAYTVRYNATDLAGNLSETKTFAFTIDNNQPVVEIVTPEVGSVFKSANVGNATFTASDTHGLKRVDANLFTGDNATFLRAIGSTSGSTSLDVTEWEGGWAIPTNLAEGVYTIRYSAHDIAGRVTTVSRTFTVDNTRPAVSLVSPTSESVQSAAAQLEIEATDAVGLNRVVGNIYKVGQAGVYRSTQSSAGGATSHSHTADLSDLPEGSYYVRYNATDLAGNLSTTYTFYFAVDNTNPQVTDVRFSKNPARSSDGSITIEADLTDNLSGLANAKYTVYKEGVTEPIYKNVPFTGAFDSLAETVIGTIDVSTLTEGTYRVQLHINDKAGNQGKKTASFVIDNSITFVLDDTEFDSATPTITGTAVWNADGTPVANTEVTIVVNGETQTVTTDENGVWQFVPLAPLANNTYPVTINGVAVGEITVAVVATEPGPSGQGGANDPDTTPIPSIPTVATPGAQSAVTFGNAAFQQVLQTTDADDEDAESGEVLGAQTTGTNQTAQATVVEPTAEGWKLFGLLWYWWLLILAAFVALWWFIAAWRRRREDDEETA